MTMAINCLLCFNEVVEVNTSSCSSRLLDLCSKFLHSSFIPEDFVNQASHHSFPFCSKCYESVMELVDLHDQVEFYQRRISEIVFMLSLGILHRRGQTAVNNRITRVNQSKKLMEFDVSSLPNWEFSNTDTITQTSLSPPENGFENVYDEVYEEEIRDTMPMDHGNIPDLRIEDIKCEVNHPDIIMDDHFDTEHVNNGYTVIESPSESDVGVNGVATVATEDQPEPEFEAEPVETRTIPTVKIQKLKFQNSERFVVVENDAGRPKINGSQNKKRKRHSHWPKSDLGSSSQINTAETPTPPESFYTDLEPPQNIPITNAESPIFTISSPDVQICEMNGRSNSPTPETPTNSPSNTFNVEEYRSNNACIEKPFKCNLCFARFVMHEELKVHTIIHQVKQDLHYCCDRCNVRFETQESLIRHAKAHLRDREFSCEICSNKFATQNGMLKHMKFHTEKRHEPHQCDLCKRTFPTKKILLAHEKIHTGERKYKCDFCSMLFSQPSGLIRHKVVHSQLYGERPYVCKICKIIFATKKSLLNHVRLHTGDHRPYQCEFCDMRFKGCSALVRHIRVHTGEKPYKCDSCEYASSSSDNLRTHKLCRHSVIGTFMCTECKKCFKTAEYGKIHYKRIHFTQEFTNESIVKIA